MGGGGGIGSVLLHGGGALLERIFHIRERKLAGQKGPDANRVYGGSVVFVARRFFTGTLALLCVKMCSIEAVINFEAICRRYVVRGSIIFHKTEEFVCAARK